MVRHNAQSQLQQHEAWLYPVGTYNRRNGCSMTWQRHKQVDTVELWKTPRGSPRVRTNHKQRWACKVIFKV